MPIIRREHNEKYTVIENATLQDRRLSWKARGILAYLLSLPDNWEFNYSDLVNRATDGRASLTTGVSELEKAGYVKINRERDDAGRLGAAIWTIRETPTCENPTQENPTQENQEQQSTHGNKVPIGQKPKGEQAPTPTSCKQWEREVRASKNRPAVLRRMFQAMFPYVSGRDLPDYPYIGRIANRLGPIRTAQLMWSASQYEPADPLRYIQGMARGEDDAGDTREKAPKPESPQQRAVREAMERRSKR